jgi:hypothetical protein
MNKGKSLFALARKYRGKPKKFAEGGRARRPAAAPVETPYDPDFIERLAARAIGSGEPVTELRSAEGRGFAPLPRTGEESMQRFRAVLRGDVEPTPNEQSSLNIVRGFTEGPAIISPATARSIEMVTRLPSDARFRRAVEATPGARISDEGLSLEVLRYQKPEQAGAQAIREGVFYLPATLPAKSVGTYRGPDKSAYGGSEMVRGETLLRAPLAMQGNTGGTVPERAFRELTSAKKLEDLISETRRRATEKHILGRDYVDSIQDLLARWGGNPSVAHELVANSNVGNRMRYALQENIIGNAARRAGYDSIVGTGARTPRISEVFDLREASYPVPGRPEFESLLPYFEEMPKGYAEGGLAALDAKYADGGTVRAPKEATIRGQGHELAYITPEEAALLKARGGSGRMTRYGVPAFDDGNGGNGGDGNGGDGSNGSEGGNGTGEGNEGATGQDAAMSEAATQDAVGGNQGQGAGPTGAGAGSTGETGPSASDVGASESGIAGISGMAPSMSMQDPEATQAAANMNTAVAAQQAGLGFGIADTGGVAPTGFSAAPGIGEAFGALGRGTIGLGPALGYAAQSAFSPPGVTVGVNVNEIGQQTPAVSIDPVGLGLGIAGLATGVPGLGMLGGMIGSQVSQALGVSPSVMSFGSPEFGSTTNTGNVGSSVAGTSSTVGSSVGGMGSSNAGSGAAADDNAGQNIDQSLSALNQRYSEQLTGAPPYAPWNWAQIQQDAAANNQTLDQYLARNWGNLATNAPRLMKHGGMVEGKKSLEELHHRYAEGGEVGDEGMARPYDPREVDTIASEFMREISPVDVTQRARMLMRGLDVQTPMAVGAQDLPKNYMRYPRNENVTSSTNYFEIPIEDDRYGQRAGMRGLSTGINAILDQERKIGIGAGLMAMENAGDYGMTGYGPRVSASYGPASIFGGYQTMTPSFTGAKPQGVYSYGGNLNIPLDEEGTTANIGGSIMSGRRGTTGMGNAGTQITGGLQVPLERLFPESNIGGTLGLDVAVDPTLRQKEILFGYRRAF